MAEDKRKTRSGFASMDKAKQKEIASKGGFASAKGDTSKRGFASMSKEKHLAISILGGKKSKPKMNGSKKEISQISQGENGDGDDNLK